VRSRRVALVGLLMGFGLVVAPRSDAAAPSAAGGIELRETTPLTDRLEELRLFSPALGRETRVRVLTPAGFDPATDRLPVLWLLHGGFGGAPDWTTVGDAEALTAGLPLLVVMPDAGQGGWYSDWRDEETSQGTQRWETYHVRELYPFVIEHYGARADRSGHAIAGLSMGGFGAMHHASRHPDLYGFAASFSGAVDLLNPGVGLVTDLSPFIMGGTPTQIWGDRITQESRWRANNPVDLASNLRTVEVQLRTGNGQPGGAHGGGPDPVELGCWAATGSLHQRLVELGIQHLHDDYGPGAHAWPYWQDDLAATLPAILAATAEVRPGPATVDHVAFEPGYSVWGHDVALDRPVYERSRLTVRPDGFALSGSGAGTVTTPPRFEAGQLLQVTTSTDGGTPAVSELQADPTGRVTVPVDLGPANRVDEYPLATVLPPVATMVDVTLASVAAGSTPPAAVPLAADDVSRGQLPATGPSSDWRVAMALAALAGAAILLRRRAGRL
jgi:S-formylglutathione hydrolase FrmB